RPCCSARPDSPGRGRTPRRSSGSRRSGPTSTMPRTWRRAAGSWSSCPSRPPTRSACAGTRPRWPSSSWPRSGRHRLRSTTSCCSRSRTPCGPMIPSGATWRGWRARCCPGCGAPWVDGLEGPNSALSCLSTPSYAEPSQSRPAMGMRTPRTIVIVVLTFALLGAPLADGGQTAGTVPRVGVIHFSGGRFHVWVEGLRQGIRELGLEEGKHLVLDIRETPYDLEAVDAAASDLERGKADLIYTVTTSVTTAAKRATVHVPLVFFAGTDPVAAGLVESLARPGGRLTGIHSQTTNLVAKRLEILK